MDIYSKELSVKSNNRSEMLLITDKIRKVVQKSGIQTGFCKIFVPHTTAGITINENADPDVQTDMLAILKKLVPQSKVYRHYEGNSDSHVKSTLTGFQQDVLIEHGRLVLGQWQGIYFCEFDGPRSRRVQVQVYGNL